MTKTLVLNATYEPLAVVPLNRAVVLVLQEKAEIVHAGDGEFRSARQSLPIPSVIRLTYFVKVPYRARLPLNRRAVLARDGHACQYCGGHATTMDHVVPRSRGGLHRWENVVACCSRENQIKDDKTLEELGWKLKRKPFAPKGTFWFILAIGKVDRSWLEYLGDGSPEFSALQGTTSAVSF